MSGSERDQPGAPSAHQGGQQETYPQNGDSCQPEQAAAASARELECPFGNQCTSDSDVV